MLSRFHLIPESLTDRQTDRQNCYINIVSRVSVLTRDKTISEIPMAMSDSVTS